jgi:hypothetical protein
MKLFSIVVSSVGLILSAKKASAVLDSSSKLAMEAQEDAQLLALAPQFAKGADMLAQTGAKMERLNELFTGKINPLIRQRVKMGVDSMRMLSAYYLHASQGEPFGDFAVNAGADLSARWADARGSIMQNRLGGDSKGGPEGLMVIANTFASLAVGALGVAARLQAQRLAQAGELGPEVASELVGQARRGHEDAERAMRSSSVDKLAKMKSGSADPSDVAKEAADMELKLARARVNSGVEVAQIYYYAGDKEAALDEIGSLARMSAPFVLGETQDALAKELYFARGNDKAFCSWARQELSIEPPASGKPSHSAKAAKAPKA